ncbi:uncharacterized protein METZ01_LOCUS364176, partial [marine metagenome]
EVLVSGPVVSTSYHENTKANALHKIQDDDTIWHRTGDVGWIDEGGKLWLCGRKSQNVATPNGLLFTMQCEEIFNAHDQVYRTALVGVGPSDNQTPVICVQRVSDYSPMDDDLLHELKALGQQQPCTRNIEHFLVHPKFPVDIRHNAKIEREELAVWAGAKLKLIKVPRAPLLVMAVPIIAWLYLLAGLWWPQPHVSLVVIWWIIFFLHFVVHPLQILKGLHVAKRVGHHPLYIACMTTIFGATYWRALKSVDARVLR